MVKWASNTEHPKASRPLGYISFETYHKMIPRVPYFRAVSQLLSKAELVSEQEARVHQRQPFFLVVQYT